MTTRLLCTSYRLLLGGLLGCGDRTAVLLNPEGRDEDVDHDNDEDEARGDVVEEVELAVLSRVVQVVLHNEDEQDSDDNLEDDGDGEQRDEHRVEVIGRAVLHDGLELRRVGHEQRDVQHALGGALLGGVVVQVQLPATKHPPAISRQGFRRGL